MPLSKERTVFRLAEPVFHPSANGDSILPPDLNFNGVPTQHSTHALHAYVAAINPPLARALIDSFCPRDGSVLDPFCGGGAVILEALLSGRRAVGGDVNPLACLLTEAKTTYIPEAALRSEYQRIQIRASELLDTVEPPDDDLLLFWYTESSVKPLGALSAAIKEIADAKVRTLFRSVLSATARDVMLTYRGEVRLRKLVGKDLERFRPEVFPAFGKRAEQAIQRVPMIPESPATQVFVHDAAYLPFADSAFTTVVCSPPYADDKNGVGYFQFSRNMLRWLGLSPLEIKLHRDAFLGSRKTDRVIPPSETLKKLLVNVQQRSAGHFREAVAFYSDYYNSIREMLRVVSDRVIIVIGDRVLSRTGFHNGAITAELFQAAGAVLEEYGTRSINKKRIKDLGGDGGGTTGEHILVFKK